MAQDDKKGIVLNAPLLSLVEWADSRQPTGQWSRIGELQWECCRCYSVGFVIQDDGDVIVLAANVADIGQDEQVTGVIVIPRVSVLKQTAISCKAIPKRGAYGNR